MAKGKKYNDDIKEKAFALLSCQNNVSYVAKALDLPYSTVDTWRKRFIAQSEELEKKRKENPSSGNNEVYEDNDELDLVRLRNKKKEEFIEDSWGVIRESLSVVGKRVKRANTLEQNIDLVADCIRKNAKAIEEHTGIGWSALCDIVKELHVIKATKLSEYSTLIGTLYDKQALANKEATQIVDGQVGVRFEDL